MDLNYFNAKGDSIEYDARDRKVTGYCKGKAGFLEQMERLKGVFG